MFSATGFIEAYEEGGPVDLVAAYELALVEETLRATYLPPDEAMKADAMYGAVAVWQHRQRLSDLIKGKDFLGNLTDISVERIDDPLSTFLESGLRIGRTNPKWLADNLVAMTVRAQAVGTRADARGQIVRPVWYKRNNYRTNNFATDGVLWSIYVGKDSGDNSLRESHKKAVKSANHSSAVTSVKRGPARRNNSRLKKTEQITNVDIGQSWAGNKLGH